MVPLLPLSWYLRLKLPSGAGLLSLYNGSPSALLLDVFPDHKWEKWKFTSHSTEYWRDIDHRKAFFDKFAADHKFTSLSDWYNVKQRDFIKYAGRSVISLFGDSLALALMATYPSTSESNGFVWAPWKFRSLPKLWFDNGENRRQFIEWVRGELNIKTLHDFYNLSNSQVIELGGPSFVPWLASFD